MILKKIAKKLGMVGASLVLMTAQMTPFFVFGGQAGAANDVSDANKVEYWCSAYDGGFKVEIDDGDSIVDFIEVDFSSDEKSVDVTEQSTNIVKKVVVKAGSTSSVEDPNIEYVASPWVGLTAPDDKEISHVIVCYDVEVVIETGRIEVKKEVDKGDGSGFVSDNPSSYGFKWGIESIDVSPSREFGTTSEELDKDSGPYTTVENTVPGYKYVGWYTGDGSCEDPSGIEFPSVSILTDKTRRVTLCNEKIQQEPEPVVVRVEKYNDTDGDGTAPNFNNSNKEPKVDVPFEFTVYRNDILIETKDTGTTGSLKFGDIQPGVITVCETEKSGWLNTFASPGSTVVDPENLGRVCVSKNLESGQQWTFVFANTKKFNIWVEKYIDSDKDGDAPNIEGEKRAEIPFDFYLYDEGNNEIGSGTTDISNNGFVQLGSDLLPGVYTVCEANKSGWLNTYAGPGTIVSDPMNKGRVCITRDFSSGENWTFVFANANNPANVVATKIVCDDEALLPNWGTVNGQNITSMTAIDWVTDNKGCELAEGWKFEYAFNNTKNPGDNKEVGGAGWIPFGPTDSSGETSVELDDVSNVNRIWVREQLKEGYLGFTYNLAGNNSDDISAEIYCNKDVLNYDNFDYISKPELGNSYYCVAWNVKLAVIRVHKEVTNNDNGSKEAEDFKFKINGEDKQNFAKEGEYVELPVVNGEYTIEEVPDEGYTVSYKGCKNIVVKAGNTYDCYVKNDDDSVPPKVYVTKHACELSQEYRLLSVINENCDDETEFKFELINNGVKYAGFGLSNGGTYDTGEGLKEGSVEVIELEKEGWVLKNANCYYYDEIEYNDRNYEESFYDDSKVYVGTKFTAENGMEYYCDFYNEKEEEIFGEIIVTKFNDLNNNGVRDEGEPTLEGWEINVEDVGSELTNEDGTATFSDLELGEYTVTETMQTGWVQTVNNCNDTEEGGLLVDSEESVMCSIGNYKKPSTPAVLGDSVTVTPPVVLATTGDNQGSYSFTIGLTLIATTLLSAINRRKELISTK